MTDAVILAGGSGTRMNAGYNKAYIKICGSEVLRHAVGTFQNCSCIDNIIVVCGTGETKKCAEILKDCTKVIKIAEGGATRQDSSYIGVSNSDADYVLIHDAARMLVTADEIEAVAAAAAEFGAAAVGALCSDTLKRCSDGFIESTLDRRGVYRIFTPQGFLRRDILDLHIRAKKDGIKVTDDCALFEYAGKKVRIINGSSSNIKLTTQDDLLFAGAVLAERKRIDCTEAHENGKNRSRI